MRVAEAQSRALLAKHGVYVTEVCDKCAKILGPVRFARNDEQGEWCSRLCRDGFEHKAGSCLVRDYRAKNPRAGPAVTC